MKKRFTIFLVLFFVLSAKAQEVKLTGPKLWKTLAEVKYEVAKDEYGDVYLPVFSDEIKSFEGKEVEIDGFIVPLEGMFKPNQLILSSLPVSECFFCGSGGPETVIEITLKEKVKYTTKRIKIRGKLKLNRNDPDKLMYQLEEGEFAGLADESY